MLEISRKTRALTAVLAVVVAFGVLAASAAALPAKFFGVVPQSVLSQEQFDTLQQGGVKSMRVSLAWGAVQQKRGGAYEWGSFDPLVERAAKSGIELLPFVIGTPAWAVPNATVPGTGGAVAPAHLPAGGTAASAWSAFLKAAVARYGAGGTFWSENPLVPQVPVKAWQIWNEPNFKYFVAKPNPTEYGKLVKISSAAIKSVDPSAQVVLAGLFSKPAGARRLRENGSVANKTSPNWFASYFLERMYKTNPGIKSRFQGVALHPYVARYRQLPAEIEEVRRVLTRAGDGSKPLWITELGWSSEPPQGPSNVFAVGASGQARELKGAFTLLKQDQAKYRIQHVYWFSVDDAPETCNFCNGSGLFKKGFVPKKSWAEFVKFTGGTA
ncbi:MAG TPA: glycosyl hydrolase [Solirubrobacterales bacterium]|nr:glycosyl hydrolase [Solirubrobacterales bacterium]